MPDGLSNSDGHLLVRRLLRPRLPHDLHDYIIEGLCKAVDGVHVLLVVKTGGGKTGLFYGYILLLHALIDLGSSCPPLKRKFPQNPVIIVVYPTKGLEEEMVSFRHRVTTALWAFKLSDLRFLILGENFPQTRNFCSSYK